MINKIIFSAYPKQTFENYIATSYVVDGSTVDFKTLKISNRFYNVYFMEPSSNKWMGLIIHEAIIKYPLKDNHYDYLREIKNRVFISTRGENKS